MMEEFSQTPTSLVTVTLNGLPHVLNPTSLVKVGCYIRSLTPRGSVPAGGHQCGHNKVFKPGWSRLSLSGQVLVCEQRLFKFTSFHCCIRIYIANIVAITLNLKKVSNMIHEKGISMFYFIFFFSEMDLEILLY